MADQVLWRDPVDQNKSALTNNAEAANHIRRFTIPNVHFLIPRPRIGTNLPPLRTPYGYTAPFVPILYLHRKVASRSPNLLTGDRLTDITLVLLFTHT